MKSIVPSLVLGALIVLFRFMPLADNFTPVLALSLAIGYLGRGHWSSFLIPVMAMGIADMSLGFYGGWAFTYIPMVLISAMGVFSQPKVARMTGLAFSSSVVFFLVSNFGVWWSTSLYAPTVEGLWTCYLAGIPFFHQTLIATLMATGILFVPIFSLKGHLSPVRAK